MSRQQDPIQPSQDSSTQGSSGWQANIAGLVVAGIFYGLVYTVKWEPLQRYFLGHPVAVAATVLFWIAVAVLTVKWFHCKTQWSRLDAVRDLDLVPNLSSDSPADRHRWKNDAGFVAETWLQQLRALPRHTRTAMLVSRLDELLVRQSQRGTTKHLADDLREISARDADSAHDSYGLVRIIVWAIPMLGFLGTVIGITQTLGGLDFTDGTAAVDRLKSGLYVAFDTTALGLVLSVAAIFVQFPVERSEQQLLGEIDTRVGHLLSTNLPTDDAVDNQNSLVAELCEGIRAAVAESLAGQANLWRQTIEEAQAEWRAMREDNANRIASAFTETLLPALDEHARRLGNHGSQVFDASRQLREQIERDRDAWAEQQDSHAALVLDQQKLLARQLESIREAQIQAESFQDQTLQIQQQGQAITTLQRALDSNLERLSEANVQVKQSQHELSHSELPNAMMTLAKVVDTLATRLPAESHRDIGRAA